MNSTAPKRQLALVLTFFHGLKSPELNSRVVVERGDEIVYQRGKTIVRSQLEVDDTTGCSDVSPLMLQGHALEVHLLNEERQNLVMENRCLESAKRGLERELSAAGPV